jgi:ATP synthase F1 gamma subunit
MPNLKAIRDRIKSVKNTRKITEAMRLVAAAKVRRAQEQVIATRPFADRLAQVLYGLQSRLKFEDVDLPLLKQREVTTLLFWSSLAIGVCAAVTTPTSSVEQKFGRRNWRLRASTTSMFGGSQGQPTLSGGNSPLKPASPD